MVWLTNLGRLSTQEHIQNTTPNQVVYKVPSLANHSICTIINNNCEIDVECGSIFNYYAKTTEVVASIKKLHLINVYRSICLASDILTNVDLVNVLLFKQYQIVHKSKVKNIECKVSAYIH